MKKITLVFEIPGMTAKEYDAAMNELIAQGKLPNPNLLSHVAFQKGNNWCVVDVWKSQEAFMDFGQQALGPIFQKLNLQIDMPKTYPVHNYIGAVSPETVPA